MAILVIEDEFLVAAEIRIHLVHSRHLRTSGDSKTILSACHSGVGAKSRSQFLADSVPTTGANYPDQSHARQIVY
jgi:hypothetical protein